MGFENIRRVIDDTLLYQPDLEKAFKHVVDTSHWWAAMEMC